MPGASKDIKIPTLDDVVAPMWEINRSVMKESGITLEFLAKKLKAELSAKETKAFSSPFGIQYSKPMIAWGVRQKARMDAMKLLNAYPSEKHDVNVSGDLTLKWEE